MSALRSHTGRSHLSTAEPTSFVGRRGELSALRKAVGDARLVTLTGAGGVGKTRLARHFATSRHKSFPDGVWLVDLTTLRQPEFVSRVILNALDIQDDSPREATEALIERLATKRLLLVLDNCEHLLPAVAEVVSKLLRTAPGVVVLATSRHLLGVQGEQVFPVPPLPLPQPGQPPASVESVQLFLDRASAVAPGWDPNDADKDAAAEVCRRLDGIPLAIELAAARLDVLEVGQVRDMLQLRLLTGGPREAPAHHHTLQAALDWSHALCSPAEATVWARCSVFTDGFDLPAAEKICSEDRIHPDDLIYLISALAHQSIITVDRTHGHVRYRLLEPVRAYARQQLIDSGEESTLRNRHYNYYRHMVMHAARHWFGQDEVALLAGIQQEWDNCRTAMACCFTEQPIDRALEFATALAIRPAFYAGKLSEAENWLVRALELGDSPTTPTIARATATCCAAWLACNRGSPHADRLLAVANQMAAVLNDEWVNDDALYVTGTHSFFASDSQGLTQLAEARDRYLQHGRQGEAHMAQLFLAACAAYLNDDPEATRKAADDCLQNAERHNAEWALTRAWWTRALVARRDNDPHLAQDLLQRAYRCQTQGGELYGRIWSVEVAGWLATDNAQYTRATQLFGAAAHLRQSAGIEIERLRPHATAHHNAVDRSRANLDERTFTAAWQAGEQMSWDELSVVILGEGGARPQRAGPASPLTRRQEEVAKLVGAGLSNGDIARRLVISRRTAEAHVEQILIKLGFTSRARIATWAADYFRELPSTEFLDHEPLT